MNNSDIKKILVFTTSFFPAVGGLERQTLSLIKEFLKVGLEVKVITSQFQAITISSNQPREEGFEVYHRPGARKMLELYRWCDVFYMPNISLKGSWLLITDRSKKWAVSHNDFYLRSKTNPRNWLKLLLMKFCSRNIAVSKSVAGYIGTPSTIIYNCYDNDIFKTKTGITRTRDFVFLGRLVSQKGCDILIRACANLKQPFKLSIIGDGPERNALYDLACELEIEKSVTFMGVLEGDELAQVLNKHKNMVIPSRGEEGFGIVALEGLACGCNVIASSSGGLPEAIGKFGKLFKTGDVADLTSCLEDSLKTRSQMFVENGNCELDQYLTEHRKDFIAQEYLKLFQRSR